MNDGGPAFPRGYPDSGKGMSLRDWFAGQALVGMSSLDQVFTDTPYAQLAEYAYDTADAMLLERDKGV